MNKKTITLKSGTKCTIAELRVKDVKSIFANLSELFADKDIDVKAIILDKYDDVLSIANGFIELVDGENNNLELDEITFSDLEEITPAFMEVNQSFLDLAAVAFTATEHQAVKDPLQQAVSQAVKD